MICQDNYLDYMVNNPDVNENNTLCEDTLNSTLIDQQMEISDVNDESNLSNSSIEQTIVK